MCGAVRVQGSAWREHRDPVAMDQELSVTSAQPRFQLGFSTVLMSGTRHLHNFPSDSDVFDVDTCTEASDTINYLRARG